MSDASEVLLLANIINGSSTLNVEVSIVVVDPCTSKLPTIIKLPPIFASLPTCNSVVGVIPIPTCVVEMYSGVLLPKPSVDRDWETRW